MAAISPSLIATTLTPTTAATTPTPTTAAITPILTMAAITPTPTDTPSNGIEYCVKTEQICIYKNPPSSTI